MPKPAADKLTPPKMSQIKNCTDNKQLTEWREYLMTHVTRLITENYIEWSIWEEMICRIDNKIDKVAMKLYLPPGAGETKGRVV